MLKFKAGQNSKGLTDIYSCTFSRSFAPYLDTSPNQPHTAIREQPNEVDTIPSCPRTNQIHGYNLVLRACFQFDCSPPSKTLCISDPTADTLVLEARFRIAFSVSKESHLRRESVAATATFLRLSFVFGQHHTCNSADLKGRKRDGAAVISQSPP